MSPQNGSRRDGIAAGQSVGEFSNAAEPSRHTATAQATVVRFPQRRSAAIVVCEQRGGGWLAIAGAHGWLHGSRDDALDDARWLAGNCGFPIREAAP